MSNDPVVAIVGVTGAVGAEFIATMDKRNFPRRQAEGAGERALGRQDRRFPRRADRDRGADRPHSFHDVDIALFSAGGSISRKYAPIAVKAGAVVVDNSSAFRMDPNVPLVIPEINAGRIRDHKGIIANPNCSAITALVPLWPIHRQNRIKRLIISTYQAASGAGAPAMEELMESTRASLEGRPFTPKVIPLPYAFNVFSHNTAIDPETGYNDEETKVIKETRKIFEDEQDRDRRHLRARAGAARALRGHHLRMRKADHGRRSARDPVAGAGRQDRRRSGKELLPDADRRLRPGRRAGRPHPQGSQRSHAAIRSRCSSPRISC